MVPAPKKTTVTSKIVGDQSRRWPEGSFFNSYYTNVLGRALLLSLDCSTLPLIIIHHHHVVPLARISLTLSRHFSLSFIAYGRSSGLHPVSSRTLYCWVLSKEVSSTIFKVFGMTWPRIEPRSPGPLANTLPT